MVRAVAAWVFALICWQAGVCASEPARDGDASLRRDYMLRVRGALSSSGWNVRPIFRAHLHGRALGPWEVSVRVTVAADGTVRDVAVESSSGLLAYDDETIRAMRAASLPPPPATFLDPATGTYSFLYWFYTPGLVPPDYRADALARTFGAQSVDLGSSFDLQRRSAVLDGSTKVAARASYERMTVMLGAAVFLHKRVGVLELQVPYGTIHYREPSTGTSVDASGFGDVALHLHGRELRRGRWTLNNFLGIELPTGKTVAAPVAGQLVPTFVQMGSGTFNPELGLCASFAPDSTSAVRLCSHARAVLYRHANDFRDANVIDARLFGSKTLLCRHLSAQAGLFFEDTREAWRAQVAQRAELFAEASVWFVLYRGLSMRSTLEVPIYRHVDGVQLADTVRFMAGVGYDFSRY